MEDIKEKTADEIRKIAQEEMAKQIRENIDSALIFSYINQLEEENKQLKIQCDNEFKRGFFMKVAENYEKTNAEIVEVKSLFIPISVIQNKIRPVIDELEKDGFVGYADELRDILDEVIEGNK